MEMISSAKWVSELEMEDPTFLNQYEMNSHLDYSFEDLNFQSFSTESHSSYPDFTPHQNDVDQRPAKQPKINHSNWNSCTTTHDHIITVPKASSSASSHLISFDNSNSSEYGSLDCTTAVRPRTEVVGSGGKLSSIPTLISKGNSYDPQACSPNRAYGQGVKRAATVTRSPLHAQDHVLAERKRREKLSQRFIALSALVPGLKKMDKASVLGDAIKYVKQMQDRMKILEEQAAKKNVESVVFVKRIQYSADEDISSSDENFDSCSSQPLPEIEARVSDKEVLLRIHCEKKKGCLANILREIEKLGLTILNSGVLPFGNSTLDITVVSEMDIEYSMTVKELVKTLRQALLELV
ncbi:transcription factor bHLH18-like [Argentina anserina]|uniref:transcription factor bHLH18-like n=1 Tax=Argentina anserina TaxID=57926 RepID=UPI0021764CE6|nr:transcription factor bHLH18-like [Potentilla anserina]